MNLIYSLCRGDDIYYDIINNIQGYQYFYRILFGEIYLNGFCVVIKMDFLLFGKTWGGDYYFSEDNYPIFIALWKRFW